MSTDPQAHVISVRSEGSEFTFETGRIARQATGAVIARSGDNVVLATVTAAREPKPGQSFFPLTVEYREKFAAVGRIPGNYQRREGRISDHEVLVCRLIDRSLRSLFPSNYRCEVQVQVQVLSAEPSSDLESLALLAAGCALHISPVPAKGPAAGLRIVRSSGEFLTFASQSQRQAGDLDFSVAVGPDGLVMLEGQATEATEADCLAAIQHACKVLQKFQQAFDQLREQVGNTKLPTPEARPLPEVPDPTRQALGAALQVADKHARHDAITAAGQGWLDSLDTDARPEARESCHAFVKAEMREAVLATAQRIDGRGPTDIRSIWCETGFLPRAHGSAVFTRGQTQAIVTCTLGSSEDSQRVDGIHGRDRLDAFLLHYNFPPYSVGETRPLRGPGRREIGHGSLARRGLLPLLPTQSDFPYTIRIESEITESNGSSSMATACGATLAMLHAGVPLKNPVAGIAMGLISDGTRHAVLSDILGDEDHLGDMDFKVIGTAAGVTAIQLDNKIGGIAFELLDQALQQARDGRLHILEKMNAVLDKPATPSDFVPRAERTSIMPESIGALIGPRGANIKNITDQTGARVSVDDEGTVLVYATEQHAARRAMLMVKRAAGILHKGRCYRGTVTGVKDFGVFVRVNAVNEGLVPIEELDEQRVQNPEDIAKAGDEMIVAVLGADPRGRLRLSRKQAKGAGEAQIEF